MQCFKYLCHNNAALLYSLVMTRSHRCLVYLNSGIFKLHFVLQLLPRPAVVLQDFNKSAQPTHTHRLQGWKLAQHTLWTALLIPLGPWSLTASQEECLHQVLFLCVKVLLSSLMWRFPISGLYWLCPEFCRHFQSKADKVSVCLEWKCSNCCEAWGSNARGFKESWSMCAPHGEAWTEREPRASEAHTDLSKNNHTLLTCTCVHE